MGKGRVGERSQSFHKVLSSLSMGLHGVGHDLATEQQQQQQQVTTAMMKTKQADLTLRGQGSTSAWWSGRASLGGDWAGEV